MFYENIQRPHRPVNYPNAVHFLYLSIPHQSLSQVRNLTHAGDGMRVSRVRNVLNLLSLKKGEIRIHKKRRVHHTYTPKYTNASAKATITSIPLKQPPYLRSYLYTFKVTSILYLKSISLTLRNIKSTGLSLKWCLAVPTGTIRPRPIRPFHNLIASLGRNKVRLVIKLKKSWLEIGNGVICISRDYVWMYPPFWWMRISPFNLNTLSYCIQSFGVFLCRLGGSSSHLHFDGWRWVAPGGDPFGWAGRRSEFLQSRPNSLTCTQITNTKRILSHFMMSDLTLY